MRALVLVVLLAGCVDLGLPPKLTQDAGRDAPVDRTPVDGKDGPEAIRSDGPSPDAAVLIDAPAIDAADDVSPPDAAPRLANGAPCASNDQCDSSQCADGFCCNTVCATACYSCAVPGSEGTCSPVPAGQAPMDDCPKDDPVTCKRDGTCDGKGACRTYPAGTECGPADCIGSTEYAANTCDGTGRCTGGSTRSCSPSVCMGKSCGSGCTTSADCQQGFFCDPTHVCAVNRTAGQACTSSDQCATHYCVDGVCCGTPCTESCFACNVPGSVGTCVAAPSGMDPRSECAQQPASTCGRAGGCNGSGACRRHDATTTCAPASCSGTTATGASLCDGLGACRPSTIASCGAYLCSGGACPTTCTTGADCASGFSCLNKACVVSNLLLLWAFDETGGSTAQDSSGNGLSGAYIGSTGSPSASTTVPPSVKFPDGNSRSFVGTRRQAVQLANMPAILRPANNITISAWYRATSVDTGTPYSGADIVTGGDNYVLRLRPTQIEFSKRIRNNTYAQCITTFSGHLDGNWHHMAGVSTSSGTKLYFDGVERCSSTAGDDIVYDRGTDLFVGRHGNDQTMWDFDGNIDEVHVYGRALSAAEIAYLAGGNR